MDINSNQAHYLEIKQWISKSEDYLDDARILFDYGKRIGPVSRIYYSSFYLGKALLLLYGRRYKKHSALISDFGRIVVKKGKFPKKYGRFLNKMFDLRQVADYSSAFASLPRRKLKSTIKTAENFVNATQIFITKRREEIKTNG